MDILTAFLTGSAGFALGVGFLWYAILEADERLQFSYWYVRRKASRVGSVVGTHGELPQLHVVHVPPEPGKPDNGSYLVAYQGMVYIFENIPDAKTLAAYVVAIVNHDPNE